MKKIRLEKIDAHLKEELKSVKFRKAYEIESAKVALAQKIAELRQEEHLKQSDLARRLGVSQQFISQIETAQESNLTLDTLLKIAKSLGRGIKISFPKLPKEGSCLNIA
ncbi:MAG: helix-turn-helix domain-containing protein [bacterium]